MVHFDHVTFTYDDDPDGIVDLSFHVDEGELCFVTGRSGSGKTTISRLITGELSPLEGTITVNGFHIGHLSRKKLAEARRTIGTVFQDYRLIRKMTVRENLVFAMQCIGKNDEETEQRIQEVLDLVELTGKSHRYPNELSGGEKQRVSIARAILNHPALIVADEPTGNLDPELARTIMALFKKINEETDTTVIVITHALDIVRELNAKTLIIEDGRLVNTTHN